MASRTVTQVRAKIETRYANTFVPSCCESAVRSTRSRATKHGQ
jgi:hypothetical protein